MPPSRHGSSQLVVGVSVGDELYARLAGDGVVVATPVGSSAYSMAAGGSLLAAATDDASLVEAAGGRVRVVEAPPENLKVTRPLDLARAETLLRERT